MFGYLIVFMRMVELGLWDLVKFGAVSVSNWCSRRVCFYRS